MRPSRDRFRNPIEKARGVAGPTKRQGLRRTSLVVKSSEKKLETCEGERGFEAEILVSPGRTAKG